MQGHLSALYTFFDKELNIRKAFQTWDGDGTGDLDVSEFTAALNSLGFSLDLLDAQAIFKFFDIDGDGRIKCWEFVRTLGAFGVQYWYYAQLDLLGRDGRAQESLGVFAATRRVMRHARRWLQQRRRLL